MTSLLERLATNAINWDTGRHSALGTQEPQGQVPSLPSRWFKRTEAAAPASPPVTDNHHGAGAEGAAGVAGRSENFLLDTGATYSVLISSSEPSPPKPVPFWVLQEKQLLKDSPEHFFVAGMDKYFPTSFWWSLSVLPPYWEKIYSLNGGSPL